MAARGHLAAVPASGERPALQHPPVDVVRTADGQRVRPVCHFCGRTGRAVEPDAPREGISVFDLPQGWAVAPFPDDFRHEYDGSLGSQYTCPACERRLRRGESLYVRREPRQ